MMSVQKLSWKAHSCFNHAVTLLYRYGYGEKSFQPLNTFTDLMIKILV